MKKSLFLLPIIFLFSCDNFINTVPNSSNQKPLKLKYGFENAIITITNIEEKSYIKIDFEIKNISNKNILYYRLFFTETYNDGTKYMDYIDGFYLLINSKANNFIILENDKKYESIEFIYSEITG